MAVHNLACYLEDNFLNNRTPVSLTAATKIAFNVTTISSARADRFRLVFKPWMQYSGCNAVLINDNVQVDWKVLNEDNLNHYEIERSADGNNFVTIGSRQGSGNTNETIAYNFTDLTTTAGEYYYRVKAISNNGVIAYSNISKVRILRSSPSLYVFPNPVTNSKINVQVGSKLPQGNYVLRLLNTDGKIMLSKKISHTGGSATYSLEPDRTLTSGNYQLEVWLPGNSRQVIQVSVQ
jgi:hypothetical protein